MTLRWFVFALTVGIICSSVTVINGQKCDNIAPEIRNDVERSPSPNLDTLAVQLSLKTGWLDKIDYYFKETIHKGKDALIQLGRTGVNILGNVHKIIPTPEAVFQASKDVFLGLPQEVIVYAIDAYCNVASHVHAFSFTPRKDQMNLELKTKGGVEVIISMDNPDTICEHPEFKKDWPTVVVVTGWLSDVNATNDALDGLQNAYTKRDVNFMFFNTAKYVDTLYTWSAYNTKGVGAIIGEALVKLSKCVDPKNLHLIGHSLGAHISGYAGRTYNCMTNKFVGRVTGLDPAHPCFREGEDISGLRRGDAEFVDIIHSNCGVLGRRSPLGDVDFYPNGRHPLQPGCLTIICSHARSWEFYAETVEPGNEDNFMATRCDSYSSLKAGNCHGKPIPMGYAVPTTAKGDFFLETNGNKPFGKRIAQTKENSLNVCVSSL